jgi:uncharacterized membrane protein
MNIDTKAPLKAKKDIVIDAPVSHVWMVQSDIRNWPKWQKDVSYAELRGKLAKGTVFTWKAMGMNITSELQEVVENKIIGWSGKSIGMSAIHVWKFEKQGNKTRVITEESLSGWFPMIIKLFKPDFLEQSLIKALETLKDQAEKKKF